MIANGSRKRIGLALSGGGFRATLFHLGIVRFLSDAGILPSVTHITSVSGGKDLEHHNRVWLNRQLVETVLRQVTGRHCLRPMTSMFDQVIVSDAGKHLQARTEVHDAGLISTAMRASDIGMDPKAPGITKAIYPSEGAQDSGGTIIDWTLLDPDPDRQYECHWVWQRDHE